MKLDSIQIRVLGALIEKEITTPEVYPLSLNAILAACNQRSSRDPVLDLEEEQIRQALHGLEDLELVTPAHGSRVPKYEHRARTVLNLRRDETAVLCLLLLRGPQTPGELRSRADRLYSFDDIAAVQSTLERLARREGAAGDQNEAQPAMIPLVLMLPRQPGSRESRYAQLLGDVPAVDTLSPATMQQVSSSTSRLAELEAEIAGLRLRVELLEAHIHTLEAKP